MTCFVNFERIFSTARKCSVSLIVIAVRYFLMVFDRSSRQLVDEVAEFDHALEALEARFDQEMRERANPSIEVVVLGAEDRQALERTHSRYFGTAELVNG